MEDWKEVKIFEQTENVIYEGSDEEKETTSEDSEDDGEFFSDDDDGMHDAELIDNLEGMMF